MSHRARAQNSRCIGALACVVLIVMASPAAGFRSLPPGTSPHDELTAQASAAAGITGKAVEALQQAVRRPDVDEMKVKPAADDALVLIDASKDYEPSHHCDRAPPVTAADALTATGMYVRLQRETARQQLAAGHAERALRALGNALHALQDCFSHSNVGELSPSQQDAVLEILLGPGTLSPPPSLMVCAFQPGIENPEMPPGDPYPHGSFNKDSPNGTPDASARLPDGRTKYDAAHSLAGAASAKFLVSFVANVTSGQKAALLALEAELSVEKTPAVGTVPIVAALALAACLATMWRRRP
jgi:hypothetical protein